MKELETYIVDFHKPNIFGGNASEFLFEWLSSVIGNCWGYLGEKDEVYSFIFFSEYTKELFQNYLITNYSWSAIDYKPNPVQFPRLYWEMVLDPEIIDWLVENMGERHKSWDYEPRDYNLFTLYFKNINDALFFKMRWY
jgi:hypothetical protein